MSEKDFSKKYKQNRACVKCFMAKPAVAGRPNILKKLCFMAKTICYRKLFARTNFLRKFVLGG